MKWMSLTSVLVLKKTFSIRFDVEGNVKAKNFVITHESRFVQAIIPCLLWNVYSEKYNNINYIKKRTKGSVFGGGERGFSLVGNGKCSVN